MGDAGIAARGERIVRSLVQTAQAVVERKLLWDHRNVEHILRHGVEYWEVEELSENDPLVIRVGRRRIKLIGQTDAGRYLVAFLDDHPLGHFVVAARDATGTERRRYRSR